MNAFSAKAVATLRVVSRTCRSVAVLLLALISVLIVTQVVGRNIFDLGMPWADELARFSGIALVFLTVPLLALNGQHVTVDLIPQLLAPRARGILAAASELAVFIFCSITLYGFHSFLSRAGKFSTPAIGIPNWLFYAPALIGFLLLALVALARLADLAASRGVEGEGA